MNKAPEKTAPGVRIEGIEMASITERFCVEALNNDVSTFEDVIGVLMDACGYDAGKARHYTFKIHTEGRAVCFWGNEGRCKAVIAAFGRIQVRCRLLET